MKNLTFLILLLFSFGVIPAQSAADCPANLSIFAEFAKVNFSFPVMKAVAGASSPSNKRSIFPITKY